VAGLRRFGLVLVGLALALLAGEGLFRLAARWKPSLQSFNPPVLVEDPVTEHALIPSVTTRYLSPEGEFDNVVRTNAWGFHDIERARAKPAGTFRVAVVGDSLVEGLHVPATGTLTQLAEQRLNGEGRRTRVEVLNAGLSGTSPLLDYLAIRERILRFAPDVVVLCVFMNDPSEDQAFRPLVAFDAAGRPTRLVATTSRTAFVPLPLKVFVKRHSRLAVFLMNLYSFRGLAPRRVFSEGTPGWTPGEPPGDIFAVLREPPTPAADRAWTFTTSLLGHIGSLLKDHETRFVVAILPAPSQVNDREWARGRAAWKLDGAPSFRPQRVLAEWGRQHDVPVLDFLPGLRAWPESPLYFPYDGHFTAVGHRAAAAVLADFLAREPWFPH